MDETFSQDADGRQDGANPFPRHGYKIDEATMKRGLTAEKLAGLLGGRDGTIPICTQHIEGEETRWAMYATVRLVQKEGGGTQEVLVIMGDEEPAPVEFLPTQAKHDPNTAPGE